MRTETVLAASPLLGHELEDRLGVRAGQDLALARMMKAYTATPLRDPAQRLSFAVAPIDLLVTEGQRGTEFQLLELNGTGIGGISNVPGEVVESMLESLREMASAIDDPSSVVLLGISGLESALHPRLNKLMHEKMVFAQALLDGLRRRHDSASLYAMPSVRANPSLLLSRPGPSVVMGYMKNFLAALEVDSDGRLMLYGRRVAGILNDRFLLNVVDHFGRDVDLSDVIAMNGCYLAGGSKAVAYELLNEFVKEEPAPFMPDSIPFEVADDRASLIDIVIRWLSEDRDVVIKPYGTGAGHGIEFFLDPTTPHDEVVARIDESIRTTSEYYAVTGGAFPYTVCPFVNARSIARLDHACFGHKYELRMVVYRDGDHLHAFPSIIKIASRAYNADCPDRLSLINNITAASEDQKAGVDYILPLCNRETLELIGMSVEELAMVGRYMARYVRHVLDRLEDDPDTFTPTLRLAPIEP